MNSIERLDWTRKKKSSNCRHFNLLLIRVANNSELEGAPNLTKKPQKAHKKVHKIFSPKNAIFLVKSTQFLTPQTIFIAFSCINFLEMSNFAIFFLFFSIFYHFFLIKGLFYCFTKAHKFFSRSHFTLKVAPMCAKAHIIGHSVPLFLLNMAESFIYIAQFVDGSN